MELSDIIKETQTLGITLLFQPLKEEAGRHLKIKEQPYIIINENLSDIAKINVILHEREHFFNRDLENILYQIPTYSHRIEHHAEIARITSFMNIINRETPIDKSFNYLTYMKNAGIPSQYESFVKDIAQKFYEKNKRNHDI